MISGTDNRDPLTLTDEALVAPAPMSQAAGRRRDPLLDRLLAHALDRPEVDEALARFLSTFPSGVFILQGSTGLGKTTELARLACASSVMAAYFVTPYAGRDAPALVVRSLYQQLVAAFDIDRPPPTDRADLVQAFSALLGDISYGRAAEADLRGEAATPVLIIIDAIDEMRGMSERLLDFLPEVLPPHIYVIVSARPYAATTTRITPLVTYTLRPMTNEQVAAALVRAGLDPSPQAVSRAGRASQGNPLFLRWYLSAGIEGAADVGMDEEGMSLDRYFGRALRALSTDQDGRLGYRLLSTLVAARAPLSLAALACILGVPRREIAAVARRAGPLLTVNGDGLALCHRSLVTYLLDPDNTGGIEHAEVRAAHLALAGIGRADTADARVEAELVAYDRRHGASHLLACDDTGELAARASRGAPRDAAWIGVALFESIWSAERALTDDHVRAFLFRLAGDRTDGGVAVLLAFTGLLLEHGMTRELSALQDDLRGVSGEGDWLVSAINVKLAQMTGRPLVAISAAETLLARPDLPVALRSETQLLLGEALREQGHHQDARRYYSDVLALIDPSEDLSAALTVSCKIADLAYVYGDLDDALRLLAEARARAEGARPTAQPIAHLAQIYRLQGQVYQIRGESEEAATLFRRSLEIALSLQRPRLIAEAYNSLAEAEMTFDLPAALRDVARGRDIAARGDVNLEYGKSFLVESEARLRQGDPDEARWLADAALDALIRVGYGSGIARAQRARAEALLALGRHEEAFVQARAALDYYRREIVYPSLRLGAYDLSLRCAAVLGCVDGARALDDPRAIPHLDQFPLLALPREIER